MAGTGDQWDLGLTLGGVPQPPEDQARAALIPAPLEATVSYGRGTAAGPLALLQASCHMELYDELLESEPHRLGICTRPFLDMGGDPAACLARIREAVARELEAGRLPVVLGGEHTVSLGALQALVERRGADFTVLVLDAHLDLREQYQGQRLSHACVMRRALELGLAVRHLGTRSLSAGEAAFIREQGLRPFWAREVGGDPHWVQRFLQGMEGPVYISLDLDGLDPAFMPATGTPEPGGLNWHQVSEWLQEVCRRFRVLGLDLVELAPIPDQPAWDFTAARLLYRTLGLALAREQG